MPPTRRRSSAMLSKSTIQAANAALQQLPEKPRENLSLKEAVTVLKDTITSALDRGYSYEEVAEMLSNQGVKISPTSLKSYLSAIQRTGATKPAKTRGRKPKASVMATPEPDETPATTPADEAPKRRGRKPKATAAEPETLDTTPTTTEAPSTRKRGPRPKTSEPAQSATKQTGRTKTATPAESGKKTIRSTTGRRKKAI